MKRSCGQRVEHLSLFGSYARGTAVQRLPDVDLIAEFDAGREYSLLGRVRLENRPADMLGVKVDLSPARALKERRSRKRSTRGRACLLEIRTNPLRDIADAAALIEEFTAGMDFDSFREDPKTIAAVERKLLIISEAAIRMGDETPIRRPDVPSADVRGIGNWLRHQYDAIELPVVWKALQSGNRRPPGPAPEWG